MRNMISTLKMDKELVRGFSIKSKDYAKYLKQIALLAITENSFLKLIKYFTKKAVYVTSLKYWTQPKKDSHTYG